MSWVRKSSEKDIGEYKLFFNRRSLCLLILFCLFFYVEPLLAKNSADKDVSWYKNFINNIGEALYFSAWPTATYKEVTLEGISRAYDGVNIKVKLHGKSAFDESSLWTEVIVEVRDGEIKDIKWGKNNAILAQPGETITGFGELLVELNKEYSRNKQQKSESVPYYVVCIINKLNGKVNYQYRWADEKDWTSSSLDSGASYWYGNKVNQRFYIKFDNSFSGGYQKTEYYLENKYTRYKCSGGKQYEFYLSDNNIDMKTLN